MSKKNFNVIFLSILSLSLGVFWNNCAPVGKFDSKKSEVIDLQSVELAETEDVVLPPPTHPGKTIEPSTTYENVMVDRLLFYSLIMDVFGPRGLTTDSNALFRNTQELGSPCILYGTYNRFEAGVPKLADSLNNCAPTSASRTNSLVMPKTTVIRAALVTRTCSDITRDKTAMSYALEKIYNPKRTTAPTNPRLPQATDENIIELYELFYRGKDEPHQALIDSLAIIINADGTPTWQTWGSALFTICASGAWQIL